MRIIIATLLVSIAHTAILAQNLLPIWEQREPCDGGSLNGEPFVMVDSSHNLIVCSSDYHPGPGLSFLTTKYDESGNFQWSRVYDTFGNDMVVSCVADHTNAIYVGGNSIQNLVTNALPGFIVIKYDANGDTLWTYRFSGHHAGGSYLSQLRLDDEQNLMVFGAYGDTIALKSALFAVKLAPDGHELWSATYLDSLYSLTRIGALRVENRWVVWGQNASAAGCRFASWQVDDSGQTLGAAVSVLYPEYNYGYGRQFIDREGALFVAAFKKYKVDKYDLSGQKVWTYEKPLPPTSFSVPGRVLAIESSTDSEVFVSGFVHTDSLGGNSLTTKLDASGNMVWEHSPIFNGLKEGGGTGHYWLNDENLLVFGSISPDPASNLGEFYISVYDKNGYVNGGMTDLDGQLNLLSSAVIDEPYLYVAGISYSDSPSVSDEQILCKYALSDLVNTQTPLKPVNPLKVGPNPAGDWTRVEMPSDCRGAMLLELSDGNGKILQQQSVKSGAPWVDLRLEGLPAGAYFLALRQDGVQTHAARILKH